uniref:Uncharacterized protein n=2 Tax=Clytia hemisphaerica TaxID=252671 RepID=A0A7M5V881_9CNID
MTHQFQSSLENAVQSHEDTQKAFVEFQSKLEAEQHQSLLNQELIKELQSSLEMEKHAHNASDQSVVFLKSKLVEEQKRSQASINEVAKLTEQCVLAKEGLQNLTSEVTEKVEAVTRGFKSILEREKLSRDASEQKVVFLESQFAEEKNRHEESKGEVSRLTEQCQLAKKYVQALESEVGEKIREITSNFQSLLKQERHEHELSMKNFDSQLKAYQQESLSRNKLIADLQAELTEEKKGHDLTKKITDLEVKAKELAKTEVAKLTKQFHLAKENVQSLETEVGDRIKEVTSEFENILQKEKHANETVMKNITSKFDTELAMVKQDALKSEKLASDLKKELAGEKKGHDLAKERIIEFQTKLLSEQTENEKLTNEFIVAKAHIQKMDMEVVEKIKELSTSLELAISKEKQAHQLTKFRLEEMADLRQKEKVNLEKELLEAKQENKLVNEQMDGLKRQLDSERKDKEIAQSEAMKLNEQCDQAKMQVHEMEVEVGEQIKEISASLELSVIKEQSEHQVTKQKLKEVESLHNNGKERFEEEMASKQNELRSQEQTIVDLTEKLAHVENLFFDEKKYSTNEIESLNQQLDSKTKFAKNLNVQLEDLAEELNLTDDNYHQIQEELKAMSTKAYTLQQRLQQRELEIRKQVDEIFTLEINEKKGNSNRQRLKFDLGSSNKQLKHQKALNRDLINQLRQKDDLLTKTENKLSATKRFVEVLKNNDASKDGGDNSNKSKKKPNRKRKSKSSHVIQVLPRPTITNLKEEEVNQTDDARLREEFTNENITPQTPNNTIVGDKGENYTNIDNITMKPKVVPITANTNCQEKYKNNTQIAENTVKEFPYGKDNGNNTEISNVKNTSDA